MGNLKTADKLVEVVAVLVDCIACGSNDSGIVIIRDGRIVVCRLQNGKADLNMEGLDLVEAS